MGDVVGGIIGGIGRKKAARQARADARAGVAKLEPFAQAGGDATGAIAQLLGLQGGTAAGEGLQRFRESIGFRDMNNRALRGVAASGAARGLLGSTGTGERFQRTAGELASGTLNDFMSQLFGLQNAGQSAATNQAQLIAGQPTSKGQVLQGVGSSLNRTFLG